MSSDCSFFKKIFIYLFIYGCFGSSFLCEGFSLVVASGGHSSSRCAGLSLSRPLLLWSTGSRCAGSVIVAHGPSCSTACGIFPDQGSNPCLLHWQADSQPLRHQGSPSLFLFKSILFLFCGYTILNSLRVLTGVYVIFNSLFCFQQCCLCILWGQFFHLIFMSLIFFTWLVKKSSFSF